MDLWSIRSQALAELQGNLKQEKEVIKEAFAVEEMQEAFALMDKCIDQFYASAIIENDHATFAAVCCQTLVKARRLTLGCYSLCLDGLELEAGAFMRLLLEVWQLLIYFQQQPDRTELALLGRLPRAGDIARTINVELHNNLKDLREHYNQTSSHISFQKEALVTIDMVFNSENLKLSMRTLFSMIVHILFEAVIPCLKVIGKMDSAFTKEFASLRETVMEFLGIDVHM